MTEMDVKVKTRTASISARVFRVKENKWVDLGVIARPKVSRGIIQKLRRILWQRC